MEEQLKLKGYSSKTRNTYIKHIKRFSSFIDKELDSVSEQDIRKYMLFLLDQKNSHSYVNQAISAVKFLCNGVLNQGSVIDSIPRPKKENKLPNVHSYTLLSEIALNELRKYYSLYKPEKWLFPGQNKTEFFTERTVERVFEKACLAAKINKRASVHTLRHSFATHKTL